MREIDRRRSSFGEDSGGDSVGENHFHGRDMGAHTRANSFVRVTGRRVKNRASRLLRGFGKVPFLRRLTSTCECILRDAQSCRFLAEELVNIAETIDMNICHSFHVSHVSMPVIYGKSTSGRRYSYAAIVTIGRI